MSARVIALAAILFFRCGISLADTDPCKSVLDELQEQGILEKCLTADVFSPTKLKVNDPAPREAVLTYAPIRRTDSGNVRCRIKPTLLTYTDANAIFSKFLAMIPSNAAGHQIRNPRINSISFSVANNRGGFNQANLEGDLTIRNVLKYRKPCIVDWELKWCEAEKELYSFGAGWTASLQPLGIAFSSANPFDKNFQREPLPTGDFKYVPVSNPSKVSPFRSLESGFVIDVPEGSADFQLHISNDLVKIAQALTRAFGEQLRILDFEFLGILHINYNQFRKFDLETYAADSAKDLGYAEEVHFVRDVLREQAGDLQHPHTSGAGKRESLALTAILNSFAGNSADFRTSTFSNVGGTFAGVEYTIDDNKLLDRIYTDSIGSPLYPKTFCGITKKNIVEELRQILEDDKRTAVSSATLPWRKMEEEGNLLFRKGGLARTINSYRSFSSASEADQISRSDVVQYMRNRTTARNFSSFNEIVQFYNLTASEKKCVRRKILSLSSKIRLVYPGTDFGDCLSSGASLSEAQSAALSVIDKAVATASYKTTSNEELAPPVFAAQYKGWFYCYRQAGACGTDALNAIRWDPGLSVFEGRPGKRNSGVDIFSNDHADGASPFRAVASGTLHYVENQGWGNGLVLPFSFEGKDYFAVYAHLGKRASDLDGVTVSRGDTIGTTGCSGETGGTGGICNSYCRYGGVYHTDESLHFEVIWRRGPLDFVPVDPTKVINNWRPSIDKNGIGNKICAECRNGNCKVSGVDGVH
ncbi:M23 family metallopeptidase [Bradyrhizobium sp. 159]|uniref:M23 family metallopeptidase n=1 Tax=Bradyrhizobium sp. 159 TaxID=2782632 RepID=UPI001FF9958E|nr:M23 family metallopeptidase [Bradyrhizobium sp. 159]MCK1621207.1 M23 family metallopeptidase [Bradyrhizobium sp. 159]